MTGQAATVILATPCRTTTKGRRIVLAEVHSDHNRILGQFIQDTGVP